MEGGTCPSMGIHGKGGGGLGGMKVATNSEGTHDECQILEF